MPVKQAEREKAAATFGGAEAAASAGGKTFEPGKVAGAAGDGADDAMDEDEAPMAKGPTAAQLMMLKAAIANAATLEEVQRLETALTTGIVPSDMKL